MLADFKNMLKQPNCIDNQKTQPQQTILSTPNDHFKTFGMMVQTFMQKSLSFPDIFWFE